MLTQKMKQPFKTAQPVLFPPLADRAAWESLPGAARWAAAGQAALADAQTAPELPLSLWLQFTRSGDRAKWEHAYFAAPAAPHDVWYPSVGILVSRRGAYALGGKAGSNADSHNHNDVGSVTLYRDGRPLLIDVGVETYSTKTFSPQR